MRVIKRALKLSFWIALGAGLATLFLFLRLRPDQVAVMRAMRSLEPDPRLAFVPTHPLREVYQYSVIPGGVESPDELKAIIEHNPEIARRLGDFDLEKAKLVRVAKPRSVYVSYRLGNLTFWSTRKLTLKEGEYLITDGTRAIRSRDGNDVSETPKKPTSPAEPTARELDTPLPPSVVATPFLTAYKELFLRFNRKVKTDINQEQGRVQVWIAKRSGYYYCNSSPYYEKVEPGDLMTQDAALQSGYQPKLGDLCLKK